MLRVEGVEIPARGGVEEGQVPLALKEPAGHGEVFPGGMKGQRFHQTPAALAFVGLVEFPALAPGEALPTLHAVAGHRIPHRTHATHIEFVALRVEHHGKYSAQVMMALDDAPTRQVGRGPLRYGFARGAFPNPTLSHKIAARDKFPVA